MASPAVPAGSGGLETGGDSRDTFRSVEEEHRGIRRDALLAAGVLEHDLTLVTGNEDDFDRLGIRILNPFSRSSAR